MQIQESMKGGGGGGGGDYSTCICRGVGACYTYYF